jgi:hypothetical protein
MVVGAGRTVGGRINTHGGGHWADELKGSMQERHKRYREDPEYAKKLLACLGPIDVLGYIWISAAETSDMNYI